jgi:hypothetical protein
MNELVFFLIGFSVGYIVFTVKTYMSGNNHSKDASEVKIIGKNIVSKKPRVVYVDEDELVRREEENK